MTIYDRYRCLSMERRGKVLVIWFNRPDALNAINGEPL
jgi:enoyl-CoA hydratase/carnithine racemase